MERDIAAARPLTGWKNPPRLESLRADLEAARSVQGAAHARIRRWRELMEIEGSAAPPKRKGRSSVQPRLVRRQAEWRYAALSEPFLSSPRLFAVEPATFEDAQAARQNELLLNWQFVAKLNRVRFIDRYVRACVDDGTAIVRLGWQRHVEHVAEEAPVWQYFPLQDEGQLHVLQQAAQLKAQNIRGFNEQVPDDIKEALRFSEESGQAVRAVQTGTQTRRVEKVLENRPVVQVCNPLNVYVDPGAGGDMDEALFVIYSFETNRAELLKEPQRYKNLDAVNWNAGVASDAQHVAGFDDATGISGENRKKVVAYEYWGLWDIHDTGKLEPVVVTWIGSTIVRMELNPFPDGKPPFVVVPYLPQRDSVFGEADAHLLEENQRIIGALTRGMIDLMGRSANAQHGFAIGMLDAVNRRRFEDGMDYEFNPNQNPQGGALLEHRYPDIPASALNLLGLQNQEAESLTGIKAFHGGLSGSAYGALATGTRAMLDAAGKREMGILRRLAQGMREVGRKICAMNGAFLSDGEVVRVTNEEFVRVRRQDLAGDFDLVVDISTSEMDEARAQDLGFMLQTLGPGMDAQLRNHILSQIARQRRMPELAKTLEDWQPPPDENTQQLAALQAQKVQAEIEKLKSDIALNAAQAQLAASRAQALGAPADAQLMQLPPDSLNQASHDAPQTGIPYDGA